MKNILVTGGAGFIGSTFVEQRVNAGDRVIVVDSLTYAGHKANLAHINPDKFKFVQTDIRDSDSIFALLKKNEIDCVYHFAAESHVDNSITGSNIFIETNINGTYSLLETTRKYWNKLKGDKKDNFRFVYVSTDEVYGSLGATGAFTEASPLAPNSPYSASKAAGDLLVRAWFHTYGLPTITTHCTNNYGARQYPEKLIPHMIECALNGKDLPVYGDGKNVRDWIFVGDHAHGIWLAATKGRIGEAYDFGGHAEMENIELVTLLCEILDESKPSKNGAYKQMSGSYKQLITFVEDRLGHDRRYAIDDSKAQKELGYKPSVTFAEGLKTTVEWYLANENWRKHVLKAA